MVWSTRPELAAAYKALGAEALAHLVNLGLYASESELERLNAAILSQGISTAMIEAESRRVLATLTNQDVKSLPPPVESIVDKSIASFPYRLSHAKSYIGDRTALVGDAAHTVHPLAGQGLNMGLADVRALAETWDRVGAVGGDLGESSGQAPLRFTAWDLSRFDFICRRIHRDVTLSAGTLPCQPPHPVYH